MNRYVMALDQGTTSSRAILFDQSGAVVAADQYEFTQHFPKPGWVEHDPIEIWDSQLRAARGVLKKANAAGSDLAAVGITNQRETALVWDRVSGEPIYQAIVWQSRQTAPLCEDLRARGLQDEVRARTGPIPDSEIRDVAIPSSSPSVEAVRLLAGFTSPASSVSLFPRLGKEARPRCPCRRIQSLHPQRPAGWRVGS